MFHMYHTHTHRLKAILHSILVHVHVPCVPVTQTVRTVYLCHLAGAHQILYFGTLQICDFQTRMLNLYYNVFYQSDVFNFWTLLISSLK